MVATKEWATPMWRCKYLLCNLIRAGNMMAAKEWMSLMLRSKLFVCDVISHGALCHCSPAKILWANFVVCSRWLTWTRSPSLNLGTGKKDTVSAPHCFQSNLVTRWWRKMQISSRASSDPGQYRGPPPNPKNGGFWAGFKISCSQERRSSC